MQLQAAHTAWCPIVQFSFISTAVVQKWNSESNVWESVTNYSYVDSITYSYTDEGLSTGNSYSYIIVASKNGADDVISVTVSVAGAN